MSRNWMRLAAGSLFAIALQADDGAESSWQNVQQLQVGQKIRLVQMDRESANGKLLSVSDESISLQAGKGKRTVLRADVLRIDRKGGKRARNLVIGAAVGAGVGVTAGAVLSRKTIVGYIGTPAAMLVGGIASSIFGMAVGAFFPGYAAVFRAPTSPP